MKIRQSAFNIYFLAFVIVLVAACETTEKKKDHEHDKEASTLRLFLEVPEHGMDQGHGVPVFRESPIMIPIEREPFLTEVDLDTAHVVDVRGGFSIQTQFNGHGALVLETTSVAHKGLRIVVQSDFGQLRWLGAPMIMHRISNGEFTFTPDASREEAERIVRGLSNVVAKIKSKEL
jgi:hypothetical protein